MACGLKRDGQLDLALIASDRPCAAAALFTTNRVKAAPVLYDQEILARTDATVRAVIANTGSANACTGEDGLARTRHTAQTVAQALGCAPDEVLVLSTGVIGLPLPLEPIERGIAELQTELSRDGWPFAAQAIMTTDTRKAGRADLPGRLHFTGIAKAPG